MGNAADLLQQMLDKIQRGFEKAYPDLHVKFYFEIFAYGCATEETTKEWHQALADYING